MGGSRLILFLSLAVMAGFAYFIIQWTNNELTNLHSGAASNSSLEAESGVTSGNLSVSNDTLASGGKFILFGISCSKLPMNVMTATPDGGFAYAIFSQNFGTPADWSSQPTRSVLRLFEGTTELGPAHSAHADIRSTGFGRFSHWGGTDGTGQSLYFSASDNTDPRSNGRSYTYCLQADTTNPTPTSTITITPTPPTSGLKYPPETSITSVSHPSVARPGYLTSITDPIFNTKVTRITDMNMGGTTITVRNIRHMYAKRTPWNSDGSYIFIAGPYPSPLLDGKTYQFIKFMSVPSWPNWSTIDPKIIYGVRRNANNQPSQLVAYNVDTGTNTVVYDFAPTYQYIDLGAEEGHFSNDGRYAPIYACVRQLNGNCDKSGGAYVLVLDVLNKAIVSGPMDVSTGNPCTQAGGQCMDWVSMSPSGNYVVIQWGPKGSGTFQGVDVYSRALTNKKRIVYSGSHADIGYDTAGNEVYFIGNDCTSTSETPIPCSTSTGPAAYSAFRLDGIGSYAVIAKSTGATSNFDHISMRSYKRPGWVYISDFGNETSSTTYDEAYAVKVDPNGNPASPRVNRFAHTHHTAQTGQDYYASPMAVPNPLGTQIIFSSEWNTGLNTTIFDYVAEMP